MTYTIKYMIINTVSGKVYGVVSTLADAQEFVLSLTETSAYRSYIDSAYLFKGHDSYVKRFTKSKKRTNDYINKNCASWRSPYQTLYCYILNNAPFVKCYGIREVVCFE